MDRPPALCLRRAVCSNRIEWVLLLEFPDDLGDGINQIPEEKKHGGKDEKEKRGSADPAVKRKKQDQAHMKSPPL